MHIYYSTPLNIEVGVDEAGRGPLIGRMYCGACIWDGSVSDGSSGGGSMEYNKCIKDSKKFKYRSDREEAYEYIKENCIAYAFSYVEHYEIDSLGLSKALIKCMHDAIDKLYIKPDMILVDGTYFRPYSDKDFNFVDYVTIPKGDDLYVSIAAASIIAKVEHDNYIINLCKEHPDLEKYDIQNNMGYGTQKHIDAIKKYGISEFHRKSFKCCK